MLIGLTYDLRDDYQGLGLSEEQVSEFDTVETINALEKTILILGYKVFRIGNVKNLVQLLAHGKRWDLVFNIAEGLVGMAREAQVPILLDIYQIPHTFSSASTMINTLDKSVAKMIVEKAGVATPEYLVVSKTSDAKKNTLKFPLFAKPVAEGTGKGISAASHIKNQKELELVCADLLNRFNQPVLVETFLSGREFTVGIMGSDEDCQVIGVLEVLLQNGSQSYSYHNKKNYEKFVGYKLANDPEALKAAQTAEKAWRALDCRDAGRIDLRSDSEGTPHFIEANPLSGIDPIHSDLIILSKKAGMDYSQLISNIINYARKRYSI